LLKDDRLTSTQKTLSLIGAGMVMVLAGYLWGLQFPVIKAIWTSMWWGWKAWATIFV
jgi:predicted acyltransferase